MDATHTILLMSDDAKVHERVTAAIGDDPHYRLIVCDREQDVANHLSVVDVHLLICDRSLIEDDVKNALMDARISNPHVARMVIGRVGDEEACSVLAKRAAAYLFLIFPFPEALIQLAVERALEMSELSRRHRVLSRELKISIDDGIFNGTTPFAVKGGWSQFEKLVYVSPKMAELCAEAEQAAKTNLPILIHGETGTGKELLARAVHFNSDRMNAPMLVQNCGGINEETLHSEIFGHVRGAFTGAISDRLGLFRAADGGTVFLDEISEISPGFQVSLLRFLQEGEVKPLGSDKMGHSDVRIIAASNRPLDKMVEKGEFRRDLYYRLKGFELEIPPLRARPEDIPVLAQFFVEKYAGVVGNRVVGITQEVLDRLSAYQFPGNVRELETEIRRMVAVTEQGGYIAVRHLTPAMASVEPKIPGTPGMGFTPDGQTLKEMVESLEKQIVSQALQRNHWNQSKAAGELGLSRVGLANKIKRYELNGL